jgi:2-polyprenyl-6-methoxyphenol hydroxylase-like FAD-dependent oxidoreductase
MKALISGAGIAGPALAWHLGKQGWKVTVVEKASELLASGQNVDVRGEALDVLAGMSLLDEVKKRNTTEVGYVSPFVH